MILVEFNRTRPQRHICSSLITDPAGTFVQAWHRHHIQSQKMGAVPVHDGVRSPAGLADAEAPSVDIMSGWQAVYIQNKKIMERTLPDALKLSIAQKIENNLFSKVWLHLYMNHVYINL